MTPRREPLIVAVLKDAAGRAADPKVKAWLEALASDPEAGPVEAPAATRRAEAEAGRKRRRRSA